MLMGGVTSFQSFPALHTSASRRASFKPLPFSQRWSFPRAGEEDQPLPINIAPEMPCHKPVCPPAPPATKLPKEAQGSRPPPRRPCPLSRNVSEPGRGAWRCLPPAALPKGASAIWLRRGERSRRAPDFFTAVFSPLSHQAAFGLPPPSRCSCGPARRRFWIPLGKSKLARSPRPGLRPPETSSWPTANFWPLCSGERLSLGRRR